MIEGNNLEEKVPFTSGCFWSMSPSGKCTFSKSRGNTFLESSLPGFSVAGERTVKGCLQSTRLSVLYVFF